MDYELELPIIDKDCPLYIRFGDIPKEGRSSIQYRNYDCGQEQGVSVYHCKIIDNLPQLILPYPFAEGIFHTLWDFLENRDRNVYLVTGKQVGTGCDNEPLITDVKIIQDITDEWMCDIEVHESKRHNMLIQKAKQNGFIHN